jgi:hypothetical protein
MPNPESDPCSLALRLGGAIFNGELQPDELRYPGLSRAAKKLLADNPTRYGQVLEDLLDGEVPDSVATKRKVPKELVRFLSRLHPEIDAALNAHTVRSLQLAVTHYSNRLLNEVDQMPIRDVPRTVATLTELLALITGNATARVEHTTSPPVSRERLLEMFNELKKGKE